MTATTVTLSSKGQLSLPKVIRDTDDLEEFWPDDLSFAEAEIRRDLIRTHAQVSDKYLAALARRHQGSLATLDKPLVQAFACEAGVVTLIQ